MVVARISLAEWTVLAILAERPAHLFAVSRLLAEPGAPVRDLRTAFLLKVRLTVRAGRSPLALVEAQQAALAPTFAGLAGSTGEDEVSLWRQHNAAGAKAFLDDLAARWRSTPQSDAPGRAPRRPSSPP